MADYISREAAVKIAERYGISRRNASCWHSGVADCIASEIERLPAADVVEVTRCKGCEYSTLPSEPTQRYGKPGTLTCHNRYAPCNRRNVSENDFCSYGKRKEQTHGED